MGPSHHHHHHHHLLRLPAWLAATVLAFACLPAPTLAQYPPPASYQNILPSPLDPDITVAYKQPEAGTCTTAFSTQKQYTGYIGIPPYTLAPIQQNYSINTFFWFIEARQVPEKAPLTIWLNGGPGASSMVGLFNEVGPCEVVQVNDGSYGTQVRQFGWDRSSNILFIDQPNQVGFSYDTATNASFNLFTNEIFEPPEADEEGLPGFMYLNGTFGTASQNDEVPYDATANTTEIAAAATWHFLQTWLAAFPQYNPATRPNSTAAYTTNAPLGINLFTESYGGKYGPVFARYFETQNQMRSNGSLPANATLEIQLSSVGIMNGLVDDLIQDAYYPFFAYNNTYGIKAISQTEELNGIELFQGANGCHDQIIACRTAMNMTDPEGYGDVKATNELCMNAQYTCNNVSVPYLQNGYDVYDIRQRTPSPDPPAAYQEYLNDARVLAAIGAKINYTESSTYVQEGFIATGDTIRGGQIEDLAYLLTLGIRVALIYGDADYICNWFGGEAVSKAVAAQLPAYPPSAPYASAFPAAGYAPIITNSTYIGGVVRQYGNLSFSRIYESGHFVPYFQPETAFTLFSRIILGDDLSTGDPINLSTFSTTGDANASATNAIPSTYPPQPTCWARAWNSTCTQADTDAMLAGKGMISYGIFFQESSSVQSVLPSSSVLAGVPGHPMSTVSMETGSPASSGKKGGVGQGRTGLTGVYTATGTPTSTKGAAAGRRVVSGGSDGLWTLVVVAAGLVVGMGLLV